MYNGIGLPTARGSGTNAYVTKNLATVYKREKISDRNISKNDQADRKPNKEILEHARKRKIEVKCAEYSEMLESQGLTEEEIEVKLENYRQYLKTNEEEKEEPEDKWVRNAELGTHEIAEANIHKNNLLREAFGLSTDFVDGSSFEKREREAKEKAAQKTYELVRTPEPSDESDTETKDKENKISKKSLKKNKKSKKKKSKLESSSKAKKSKKLKKKNKAPIEDSAKSSDSEDSSDSDDEKEKIKKKSKKQKSKSSKKHKEIAIDDSMKSEGECDTDSDDDSDQVRKKRKSRKLKKNRKNESKTEHETTKSTDHHSKSSRMKKRKRSSSPTSEKEESRKLSSDDDSSDSILEKKRKKSHKNLEDQERHEYDKFDIVKSSWDVKSVEKKEKKTKRRDHESSPEDEDIQSHDDSTDRLRDRRAKCHLINEDPDSLKHSWKIDYPQSRDHKNRN